MEVQEILTKWSQKLTLSKEEIDKQYAKTFAEINKEYPSMTQEEKEKESLRRLQTKYKRMLRSPAVPFEGVVLGSAPAFDLVAKMRQFAIQAYKKNQDEAIQKGLTDEFGNPLDIKEKYASGKVNPGFNKPLPKNNFLKNIFGICASKGAKPKFFIMTLSGRKAEIKIPLFKPVNFMAINKSKDGDEMLLLSSSSTTEFEIDDSIGLPKKGEDVDVQKIINGFVSIKQIKELDEYHENTKENMNRFVCVEGSVVDMNMEPNKIMNRKIILTDSVFDFDDNSTMSDLLCWCPMEIPITFGESSKVLVFGKTARGKKQIIGADGKYQYTDEPGDVFINIYGIYPTMRVGGNEVVNKVEKEDYQTPQNEEDEF